MPYREVTKSVDTRTSATRLYARCILFDLDGTLYDSPEYSKRLEEEIAKVVSEELSLNENYAKLLLERKRKEIGTLTRTIESMGVDRNHFYEELSRRIEPRLYISSNPKIHLTIEKLKRIGFSIGLVSNSGRELVRKILDAIGVEAALFDTIVTSTEAQPKPSPEPFLLAIESLGCDRDDAVYVGDREEAELRPARELGLKTILVSVEKQQSRWADVVVASISQLPEVLIRE
jgi:putative hydrolase of the HAD superfamily